MYKEGTWPCWVSASLDLTARSLYRDVVISNENKTQSLLHCLCFTGVFLPENVLICRASNNRKCRRFTVLKVIVIL